MNEPELVKPMREVCDDKRNDKLRDKLRLSTVIFDLKLHYGVLSVSC